MAAHQALVEALLAMLAASADAADLAINWARLEAYFDTIFITEPSIDALKRAILELAVYGKLVPQNSDEESAEFLLSDLAKEREKLLDSGYPNNSESRTQLKKQQEQALPIGLEALPKGWSWATLMQSSLFVIDCKNKTAPYAANGVRLVRTTNVRHGRLNDIDQRFVDQATYEQWSLRAKPEPGDILITREAPMGEACIVPESEVLCLGQRMMLARTMRKYINPKYLLITFMAPDLMERVQDKPIGMTVEHLRVGGVETLLVPVPPLPEQDRIVAKVEELMALCDAMIGRLGDAAATQRHLADSIVDQAAA